MIGRIVWFIAIAAVAVVTAAIQLDRQARYVPALASAVPAPFRAFAQGHVAASAMQGSDPQRALQEARLLVARRPMPAEHLRLLGIAEFEAGEPDRASYAIQLAARRGWRDPLSQEAMMQLALAASDQSEAAKRFAALFIRPDEDDQRLRGFAEALFTADSEEARATFSEIVAGAQRWHKTFLRRGASVLEPATYLDIIMRAQDKGARFDCKALQQIAQRLGRKDASVAAQLESRIAEIC